MGTRDKLNIILGTIWSYVFIYSLTKDVMLSVFFLPAGVGGTAGAILLFHQFFGQSKVNSSLLTGKSAKQKMSIFLTLVFSSCVAIALSSIVRDSKGSHKALMMFMSLAIIFANHAYDWIYCEAKSNQV